MSGDRVTLTLPRDRDFFGIAGLVLGGLAARLDVTVEHLDDLGIALAGLLERMGGERPVTVSLSVEGEAIRATVGPDGGGSLRAELDRDAGDELDLRRLLDAVVDRVDLVERDGAEWVELTKKVGTG